MLADLLRHPPAPSSMLRLRAGTDANQEPRAPMSNLPIRYRVTVHGLHDGATTRDLDAYRTGSRRPIPTDKATDKTTR